ncbi:lasso peptide biosynthesis PqqD family chaperone [Gorillibacterium massiliense]|uniref:lasso peptide biosynthesis PqqD family chaperone n=1 Tax=Gorillibacterium massiliense TaxID=1280390 RepID=UPI0004B09118|nr:lasso peptide biosynthesis PqqD family chaperone [Gorillibacterium massiliense]
MTKQTIVLEDTVCQGKGNLVSSMDGEKVLMNIGNGKYYNLGEIGGRIWDLIEAPTPVSQLIDGLMEEYEVKRSTCEEHVFNFLQTMLTERLLEVQSTVNL